MGVQETTGEGPKASLSQSGVNLLDSTNQCWIILLSGQIRPARWKGTFTRLRVGIPHGIHGLTQSTLDQKARDKPLDMIKRTQRGNI